MEVDHHHHHHHQPAAKDRQTRGTAGWASWLVGSTKFISEEKRRERERERPAGAGRSRQDKKRNEEEEGRRKKKEEKCNHHHELAVGYHCQGAIETRRSRLELEDE